MKTIRIYISLSFIATLVFGYQSWSLPGMPMPCLSMIHQTSVAEYQGLIHTVSQVGPVQNLFEYDDYRANHALTLQQMHQRYSGTGQFHCGGMHGGANIVKRGNLLLLDAHAFFHIENGVCYGLLNHGDFSKCYFNAIDDHGHPINNSENDRYYIKAETIQIGDACINPSVAGDDWAVVELKRHVPGVVPYDIYDVNQMGTRATKFGDPRNLPITVVAAANVQFPGDGPNICDGIIGYIGSQADRWGAQQFRHTNSCSSGYGSSGGAVTIIESNGRSAIIGLVTNSPDGLDGIPYGPKNFTMGNFMEGNVINALNSCENVCPARYGAIYGSN